MRCRGRWRCSSLWPHTLLGASRRSALSPPRSRRRSRLCVPARRRALRCRSRSRCSPRGPASAGSLMRARHRPAAGGDRAAAPRSRARAAGGRRRSAAGMTMLEAFAPRAACCARCASITAGTSADRASAMDRLYRAVRQARRSRVRCRRPCRRPHRVLSAGSARGWSRSSRSPRWRDAAADLRPRQQRRDRAGRGRPQAGRRRAEDQLDNPTVSTASERLRQGRRRARPAGRASTGQERSRCR